MTENNELPAKRVHTLVVGSGAAGLSAAAQLRRNGIRDILILTEGLDKGTSINTGSDKQTYYKLSLCGGDADSPRDMAATYFEGGSMHGDLALVEAGLSARAFLNLVELGVPFPQDSFGQFVGYKTDHDPRQRATSVGPYTSRDMCLALSEKVRDLGVPIEQGIYVVKLLTIDENGRKRACGAVALDNGGDLRTYLADNVVFAVGGPGGLYKTSAYPKVHTGAIGVALLAGARAQGLPESQYGLASIEFRWNVSGTYMQVVPRVVSTAADGCSEEREFLFDYFDDAGECCSNIFLKGYQWPFDSRKVVGGSSIIDILVYVETVEKGRRVFLDYRRDSEGFSFNKLSGEARDYLRKSGALLESPIERLARMNPSAIELYAANGINLRNKPLEIAVCAQHNNGGLAANHWWESLNIAHLFPVGEVNGSHGVYRPGGSALNSGQVGAFRAADYICNRYHAGSVHARKAMKAADDGLAEARKWMRCCDCSDNDWSTEREELQKRMSKAGAHIRSRQTIDDDVEAAWSQWKRLEARGCRRRKPMDLAEAFATRQLCYAHAVYLSAIQFALQSGVGSRGSSVAVDAAGESVHPGLHDRWRIAPEDVSFRDKILETEAAGAGARHAWVPRRPIPESDTWFETAWRKFRNGEIYGP